MGILPTKAQSIDDPLEAHGFVLLGPEKPIVLLALDWCEVRNGAYDQWRSALAAAAGTDRERVLVSCLHQHDAPVADSGAQALLDTVGLAGELYDTAFHAACIERVVRALAESLKSPQPVTHLGIGQAKVVQVASSRRVVLQDGRVTWDRYSASGGDPLHRQAPEGEIDPYLKTISFWRGEQPLLALHSYATHPMSYYGRGGVSADFVGLARRRRSMDQPQTPQIYVTGCSGDVTAGKYNDGTPLMRQVLADRIYQAMKQSWAATERFRLESFVFRSASLELPFHEGKEFTRQALERTLADERAKTADRILAAMALSSLDRIAHGQKIDLPCIDLGRAKIVLFPGEAFVGYQLMTQRMAPDSFVLTIGYGECWPGYIPTDAAFRDRFRHGWRWAGPGSEQLIRDALQKVLHEDPLQSEAATDLWLVSSDGHRTLPLAGADKPYGRVFNDQFYGRVAFSPDGRRLAFIADDGRAQRTPEELAADLYVVRSDQGEGYTGYGTAQVWVAELEPEQANRAAKSIRRLTDDDIWYGDPQWSPDGRTLYCHANKSGDVEAVRYSINKNFDIWAIDVASGEQRQVTSGPGPEVSPRVSPDGSRLAMSRPVAATRGRDAAAQPHQLRRPHRDADLDLALARRSPLPLADGPDVLSRLHSLISGRSS